MEIQPGLEGCAELKSRENNIENVSSGAMLPKTFTDETILGNINTINN